MAIYKKVPDAIPRITPLTRIMVSDPSLWQDGALMLPILSPDGGLPLPYPPELQPTTVEITVTIM